MLVLFLQIVISLDLVNEFPSDGRNSSEIIESLDFKGNWTNNNKFGRCSSDASATICANGSISQIRITGMLETLDSVLNIKIGKINYHVSAMELGISTKETILFEKNFTNIENRACISLVSGKACISNIFNTMNDKYALLERRKGRTKAVTGRYIIEYPHLKRVTGVWTDTGSSEYTTEHWASKEYAFNGTRFWLFGMKSSSHGSFDFHLNGAYALSSTSYADNSEVESNVELYMSPEYGYGEHRVKVVQTSSKLEICSIQFEGHSPLFTMTSMKNLNKDGNWEWEPNNDGSYSKSTGSSVWQTFVGSRFYIIGYFDRNHGNMIVYLDGVPIADIPTNTRDRILDVELYDSGEIYYGEHTFKVEAKTNTAIGINRFKYYNDTDNGVFMFGEFNQYLYSGSHIWIRITRTEGREGNANVRLVTIGDTALAGEHFTTIDQKVTFSDGDDQKFIKLDGLVLDQKAAENFTLKCKLEIADVNSHVWNHDYEKTITFLNIDTKKEKAITVLFENGTTTGTWDSDGTTSEQGATWSYSYTGSIIAVYGSYGENNGHMKILIDEVEMANINTVGQTDHDVVLYINPNLPHDEHTIKVACSDPKQIGLSFIEFTDLVTHGRFEIETSDLSIYNGLSFLVKIIRIEGVTGAASFRFQTKSGENTVAGTHFEAIDESINFADRQTETSIRVFTKEFEYDPSQTYSFTCEISEPTDGTQISIKNVITVHLTGDVFPHSKIYKIESSSMTGSGEWTEIDGYLKSNVADANKIATFRGSKAYVYGFIDADCGDIEITIDSLAPITVNTKGPKHVPCLLFVSDALSYGSHTVKVQQKTESIGICFFRYYDSHERGIFNIEQKEYVVEMNGTVDLNIERKEGTVGTVHVNFEIADRGNATADQYDWRYHQITFNQGSSSGYFKIYAGNSDFIEDINYTMKVRISSVDNLASVGSNYEVEIIIIKRFYPAEKFVHVPYNELTKNNLWTGEVDKTYGGYSEASGASVSYTFVGIKAFVYGYYSFNHGECKIIIDDSIVTQLNTGTPDAVATRKLCSLLGTTPFLKYGSHTIKVERISGALGINFFDYLSGYRATPEFSASKCFGETNGFSITDAFSMSDLIPTDKFSKSIDFSVTNQFAATNPCSISAQFLKSTDFSSSNDFAKSKKFSETSSFGITEKFLNSSQFGESYQFSLSGLHERSEHFLSSNNFFKSEYFSISHLFDKSAQFSTSSLFDKSSQFSTSTLLNISDHFSTSINFSKTKYFLKSHLFDESAQFSTSKLFNISDQFHKTRVFASSDGFGASDDFSISTHWDKTNFFSNSNDFVPSETILIEAVSSLEDDNEFGSEEAFSSHKPETSYDSFLETGSTISFINGPEKSSMFNDHLLTTTKSELFDSNIKSSQTQYGSMSSLLGFTYVSPQNSELNSYFSSDDEEKSFYSLYSIFISTSRKLSDKLENMEETSLNSDQSPKYLSTSLLSLSNSEKGESQNISSTCEEGESQNILSTSEENEFQNISSTIDNNNMAQSSDKLENNFDSSLMMNDEPRVSSIKPSSDYIIEKSSHIDISSEFLHIIETTNSKNSIIDDLKFTSLEDDQSSQISVNINLISSKINEISSSMINVDQTSQIKDDISHSSSKISEMKIISSESFFMSSNQAETSILSHVIEETSHVPSKISFSDNKLSINDQLSSKSLDYTNIIHTSNFSLNKPSVSNSLFITDASSIKDNIEKTSLERQNETHSLSNENIKQETSFVNQVDIGISSISYDNESDIVDVPISSPNDIKDGGRKGGMIAGIVIGVLVVLIIVVVLIVFLYLKKNKSDFSVTSSFSELDETESISNETLTLTGMDSNQDNEDEISEQYEYEYEEILKRFPV